MTYIRNYKSFVNEQKKYVEKQSAIITKQIYKDLSNNFWQLCLKSEVFDINEKKFINERLVSVEVNILNEEWKFLDKALNYVKDKGVKFVSKFKERIQKVIDGIKWFTKGILNLCRNVFLGMLNGALELGKKLSTSKKTEIEAKIKTQSADTVKDEIPNLKKIFNYLRTGDENGDALKSTQVSNNLSSKLQTTLESGEANIQSTTLKELQETENEAEESDAEERVGDGESQKSEESKNKEESKKNENYFYLDYNGEDLIKHFYEYPVVNEASVASNIKSSAFKSLVDWFNSFIEKKPDPDISSGKKLIWWGRLILRVLSSFFGLVVKVAELVGEVLTNASLSLLSKISKWAGGPGPFKFVALGSIVGALVGIVGDVCLLVGQTPFPGMEEAMSLKKWFISAFNAYSELDPIAKIIKVVLTVAAIGFAIYHVHHTLHELKGHGHDEHKDGDETKTGAPVKSAEKPEAEAKPAAPGAKPAVA